MKKYLLSLFLIVFIVPSVALASWWNPLSWGNNKTVGPVCPSVAPEIIQAPAPEPEIVIKEVEKKVTVEKKIPYDNPDLLQKIEILEAKNAELNTQLVTSKEQITNTNTSCKNALQELEVYNETVVNKVGDKCTETINKISDSMKSSYQTQIDANAFNQYIQNQNTQYQLQQQSTINSLCSADSQRGSVGNSQLCASLGR